MTLRTCSRLALLALIFPFTACTDEPSDGSGPDGGTPPVSAAGTWTGMTDDDGPVVIEVGDDQRLNRVSMELEIFIGTGTCTGTFAAMPGVPITDNRTMYTGELTNPGGEVQAEIEMTFDRTMVTGTYDVNGFAITCGGSFSIGSGGPSGTFTARRGG